MSKSSRSTDTILIEARHRLVLSHGLMVQIVVEIFLWLPLLEQGMSTLMDDRIHAGCEGIIIVMGGDSHIIIAVSICEGMLALCQGTTVWIHTDNVHELTSQANLALSRYLS